MKHPMSDIADAPRLKEENERLKEVNALMLEALCGIVEAIEDSVGDRVDLSLIQDSDRVAIERAKDAQLSPEEYLSKWIPKAFKEDPHMLRKNK